MWNVLGITPRSFRAVCDRRTYPKNTPMAPVAVSLAQSITVSLRCRHEMFNPTLSKWLCLRMITYSPVSAVDAMRYGLITVDLASFFAYSLSNLISSGEECDLYAGISSLIMTLILGDRAGFFCTNLFESFSCSSFGGPLCAVHDHN